MGSSWSYKSPNYRHQTSQSRVTHDPPCGLATSSRSRLSEEARSYLSTRSSSTSSRFSLHSRIVQDLIDEDLHYDPFEYFRSGTGFLDEPFSYHTSRHRSQDSIWEPSTSSRPSLRNRLAQNLIADNRRRDSNASSGYGTSQEPPSHSSTRDPSPSSKSALARKDKDNHKSSDEPSTSSKSPPVKKTNGCIFNQCDGDGRIYRREVIEKKETCSHCHGDQTVRIVCPSCKGKRCHDCKYRGVKLRESKCRECDGTGTLESEKETFIEVDCACISDNHEDQEMFVQWLIL
jgi:hypothetical protein